jgi:hypothetical protein
MAAPTKSLGNMQVVQYAVKWKTETIGWTEDVDPNGLKELTIDKKVGEIGDAVLDRVHVGVQGSIKMVLREVVTERLRQLMPWAAATGSFALRPTTHVFSEYANAGLLVLHPRHLADNVTTDDITLLKAFPIPSLPKTDSKGFAIIDCMFNIYMDQDALSTNPPTYVMGYRGPAPT